ncbi:MAG: hypothetical protein JNK64_07715 [Myxococcales bacterium]|nr:hypothetical protein [Myxococcales bacterium]
MRGYDEQDLHAEARLADDNSEESVRGSLEIRSIADEDGTPRYDAFTYFGDAGALFLTGTTEEAGWVGQGGVVLATPDDALRIALDVALGPRARMATPPAGS